MSLESEILADNPAFLLKLTDPSGTTAEDSSPNNRDGAYLGTPSLASVDVIPGEPAWDPDGSNDAVSVAYDAALSPGTGDFLVEWWIKGSHSHARATDDFETIFVRDVGDTGNGIDIFTNDPSVGAVGSLRVYGGSTTPLNGTTNVNDGLRHHCWVERRSGVLSLYVDTHLDISAARAGNVNGSGSPVIYHGRNNAGAAPTGAENYWQTTPTSYLAYWAGTIPGLERMAAHYHAGFVGSAMPIVTPRIRPSLWR